MSVDYTLKEIRDQKRQLQIDITAMVLDFERCTGTTVSELLIYRKEAISGITPEVNHIRAVVRVEI